jgi:ureidoacrylate peracid hydrolase
MQTLEIQARPEPVAIDVARTGVLVIDMQNAFGSPGGMFDKTGVPISGIQAVVAPTRAAVEAARRAGMKIVYLKMGFMPDLSDLGAEDVPHGHFLLHNSAPVARMPLAVRVRRRVFGGAWSRKDRCR